MYLLENEDNRPLKVAVFICVSDWLSLQRLTFKMYAWMLYVHRNKHIFLKHRSENAA